VCALKGEGRSVIVINLVIKPGGLLAGLPAPEDAGACMQAGSQDQEGNRGKDKCTEESQQHQFFIGVPVGLQRI